MEDDKTGEDEEAKEEENFEYGLNLFTLLSDSSDAAAEKEEKREECFEDNRVDMMLLKGFGKGDVGEEEEEVDFDEAKDGDAEVTAEAEDDDGV